MTTQKIFAGTLENICRARGVKMRAEVVEETGSTNADASARLRSRGNVPVEPFAIFANLQTAGRGRAGRSWANECSGNICVSFGFSPMIAPVKMANFTLWMGASVCEMLVRKYSVPALVKWPNDLFCGGKKLAGILTDVHMDSERVHGVVFGIGLNVQSVPVEVENIATCVAREAGRDKFIDVNEVAADLVEVVEHAAEKFFAGTFEKEFPTLWARFDMLCGNAVSAVYGNEEISGRALGVDSQGRILIEISNGNVLAFAAGDVSLKKNFI